MGHLREALERVGYRIWALVERSGEHSFHSFFFFFFWSFCLFRAAPTACGGSQARGLIGAVAAGLHHSHRNATSEPRRQPTPQLSATPDP